MFPGRRDDPPLSAHVAPSRLAGLFAFQVVKFPQTGIGVEVRGRQRFGQALSFVARQWFCRAYAAKDGEAAFEGENVRVF